MHDMDFGLEFDPVGSARFIPDMIKNDTLIDVLDQNQLSKCLKHITLNVDDSLYILKHVQTKYKLPDRITAVHNIITDFGDGDKFDSKKFVKFIRSLAQCLNFDFLNSIATIVESSFSKIDQLSSDFKTQTQQIPTSQTQSQQIPTSQTQTQQMPTSQTQSQQIYTSQTQSQQILASQGQSINKNIKDLKRLPKTEDGFESIYNICQRIAYENDIEAMQYAINERFVYVIGRDGHNVFTRATENNKH